MTNSTPNLQPSTLNKPLISICIPTYNRAHLISEAIESALVAIHNSQCTMHNFEIVIVDDGSTDNTKQVIEGIIKETSPLNRGEIRYFYKENEKIPKTRNRLIKEARGEFILWLDSDDLLYPDILKKYCEILGFTKSQTPNIDIICCNIEVFDTGLDEQKQIFRSYDYSDEEKYIIGNTIVYQGIYMTGSLIRRELLLKVGGFDTDFLCSEDTELFTRLAKVAKFYKTDKILYRLRTHDSNVISGSPLYADKSYGSLMIKKLIATNPLNVIFPNPPDIDSHSSLTSYLGGQTSIDWSEPDATTRAYSYLARGFFRFADYHSTIEILKIADYQQYEVLAELYIRANMGIGKLDEAIHTAKSLYNLTKDEKYKELAEDAQKLQSLSDCILNDKKYPHPIIDVLNSIQTKQCLFPAVTFLYLAINQPDEELRFKFFLKFAITSPYLLDFIKSRNPQVLSSFIKTPEQQKQFDAAMARILKPIASPTTLEGGGKGEVLDHSIPNTDPPTPNPQPRKKILYVLNGFLPHAVGGIIIYTHNIAKEINKSSLALTPHPLPLTIDIFHTLYDKTKPEYTISKSIYDGIDVYTLNKAWEDPFSPDKIMNHRVGIAFIEFLKANHYDAIHFHSITSLSAIVCEVAQEMKIPTYLTLHNQWFLCHSGEMMYKNESYCTGPQWNTKCSDDFQSPANSSLITQNSTPHSTLHSPHSKCIDCLLDGYKYNTDEYNALNNLLEFRKNQLSKIFYRFDKVFAVSEYLKDLYQKYFDREIIVNYIGFNEVSSVESGRVSEKVSLPRSSKTQNSTLQTQLNTKPSAPNTPLTFGFIGRIVKIKAVHLLINAFKRLSDPNIRLQIHGIANDYQYLEDIKNLAKSDPRITFHGDYPQADIPKIMSNIDIVVVPSLCETYGIVTVEAFQHKTPVIASKTGGIPEVVKDGINGLLFENNNENDLYQKMQYVLNNKHIIPQLAQNCHIPRHISDEASWLIAQYYSHK